MFPLPRESSETAESGGFLKRLIPSNFQPFSLFARCVWKLEGYYDTQDIGQLEEAIQISKQIVSATPTGRQGNLHARYALASCISARFFRLGLEQDANEHFLIADGLLKDYPNGWKGTTLSAWPSISKNDLISLLCRCFMPTAKLAYKVDICKQALESESLKATDRYLTLVITALILVDKYRYSEENEDIEAAHQFVQQADSLKASGRIKLARRPFLDFWGCIFYGPNQGKDSNIGLRTLITHSQCLCRSPHVTLGDLDASIEYSRRTFIKLHPWKDTGLDSLCDFMELICYRIWVVHSQLLSSGDTEELHLQHANDKHELDQLLLRAIALIPDVRLSVPQNQLPGLAIYGPPGRFLELVLSRGKWNDWEEQGGAIVDILGFPLQKKLLALCSKTLDLLPNVVILGLGHDSRIRILRFGPQLSWMTASLALTGGAPKTAILALETGRSLFWNQHLFLRDSFRHIPKRYADRLRALSTSLLAKESADVSGNSISTPHRLETIYELNGLVGEIRQNPDFVDFMRRPALVKILPPSMKSPIVILVPGKTCFAIIIHNLSKIEHLSLPDLDYPGLRKLLRSMHRGDQLNGRATTDIKRLKVRMDARGKESEVLKAFSDLFKYVVKPVICALALSAKRDRSDRPRLWWCPTDLFCGLPLHASGIYTPQGKPIDCTSDYCVSSYTPSLSALAHNQNRWMSREKRPGRIKGRVLVAAEANPNRHGLSYLPDVDAEISCIQSVIPNELLMTPQFTEGGSVPASDGIMPCIHSTPDDVVAGLPHASVLHICCHAEQGVSDALKSRFFLRDKDLTLAELLALELPEAYVAVLCACETHSLDVDQIDQSVNLTTAFFYAGFPSVVGTLWSMADGDGPLVADILYRSLFQEGRINMNPDCVAYAVDEMMRTIREGGSAPRNWATFIHVGI
ncbi:CHAT domain-containing protein [Rhodocollybia butyracea]|uniref:CHAT domain-containing protein n=1 Tax=Rhodocollybia butyracea TaxID=206335 RepID=A0A9P5PKA8_9AGAR|nr:CHAT domain-containing protein [Rhodocollybia butyracea]